MLALVALALLTLHGAAQQGSPPAAVLKSPPAAGAMEFSDQPHFSIAGVTDWTAAGGHGSDTTLRTSESLARATAALTPQPGAPNVSDAVSAEHRERATAQRHAAEAAEAAGDPLTAVREFEQAATLDPSEQNEFEWGSELLMHRAIWQAEKVFLAGLDRYPHSMRMQTGLGAALFAGARYEDAATHLCTASDLDPMNQEPYVLLGKIQIAAPDSLPCIIAKLQRFVRLYPQSAQAYYLEAMAMLKQSLAAGSIRSATALLQQATRIDPRCSDAYLELGVLASQDKNFIAAINYFQRAVTADPQSADAHYRLAVAYDRTGNSAEARAELAIHDRLKQEQAARVEAQRRSVKQFLFTQSGDPTLSKE
jgi:tetratricopeptide (TPR) repeat protein